MYINFMAKSSEDSVVLSTPENALTEWERASNTYFCLESL